MLGLMFVMWYSDILQLSEEDESFPTFGFDHVPRDRVRGRRRILGGSIETQFPRQSRLFGDVGILSGAFIVTNRSVIIADPRAAGGEVWPLAVLFLANVAMFMYPCIKS